MQLTNDKLVERGARLVAERGGIDVGAARGLLLRSGSVRRALETLNGEDDVS